MYFAVEKKKQKKNDLLMNCIYTIAKKTAIGMAEMQDTNSNIMYKLVAISQ
jgi:hypothetical protein